VVSCPKLLSSTGDDLPSNEAIKLIDSNGLTLSIDFPWPTPKLLSIS